MGQSLRRETHFNMSIHATKPETDAAMRRQRRTSFISSMAIGVLSVVLLMLLLSFFLLDPLFKETPTIVTYESSLNDETEMEVKKVATTMDRKPSAPSSSMAKVIAAQTQSTLSVPVPDVEVTVPSVDFGDGEDFGQGWGSGSGSGTGGGGASFFQQKVSADRIAYVIDYSLSMRGERDKLMRAELKKSVEGLSSGMQYQLIFFSGPAWVAGSELPSFNYGSGKATVKGKGGRTYEWTGKGLHDWTPKGKREPVEWLDVSGRQMKETLKVIEETALSGGTDWENPLLMAFDAEPPPQIVFFMTDGAVGGRDMMQTHQRSRVGGQKEGDRGQHDRNDGTQGQGADGESREANRRRVHHDRRGRQGAQGRRENQAQEREVIRGPGGATAESSTAQGDGPRPFREHLRADGRRSAGFPPLFPHRAA